MPTGSALANILTLHLVLHIFFKQEYYYSYSDENSALEMGAVRSSD